LHIAENRGTKRGRSYAVRKAGVQDRLSHSESKTAKPAAETATPNEGSVMYADELFVCVVFPESCSASVTSSLRTQPVFAVISLGQTTRLKFAL
jgi:hypothetical protein